MSVRVLIRIQQTWFFKELEKSVVSIGRSSDSDLSIPMQGISRRHARLFRYGHRWAVMDLGSRHGTRVNGEPIDARGTYVGEQDVVELGPAQIGVQLRIQTDMSRSLPPNCQPLVDQGELSVGGSGPISPPSDDEETQITSALPPPRAASVPPKSVGASQIEALVAPPPASGGLHLPPPVVPKPVLDSPDMLPSQRFVPGGTKEDSSIITAALALHPILLAKGEAVLRSLALGHHSLWITDQRVIWKGAEEYQSLFWQDVLAASAEGGLLSFRMRESAMGVDLPVGNPHAGDLLPSVQQARESFDARRAGKR